MILNSQKDLITRLRKRAEIRRQISTRKSVQEGKPDKIADLLEEAADEIEVLAIEAAIRRLKNYRYGESIGPGSSNDSCP